MNNRDDGLKIQIGGSTEFGGGGVFESGWGFYRVWGMEGMGEGRVRCRACKWKLEIRSGITEVTGASGKTAR